MIREGNNNLFDIWDAIWLGSLGNVRLKERFASIMLTVKEHIDAYSKAMERRRAMEAKQWGKYWDGKLRDVIHRVDHKNPRQMINGGFY